MFEFDPAKSAANAAKHGIDFVEAQKMWDDTDRIWAKATTTDEERWLTLAVMGGKVWAAIYTFRGERIRLISVRRARKGEVEIYERHKERWSSDLGE